MISHEQELACVRLAVEFQHYLFHQIEARRAAPRDDLISHMVMAPVEKFGGRTLTTEELISMIDIILLGGNDTTINLLSSGLALLLRHPEQLALVTADPTLIPNFVEEALRIESPVQCLFSDGQSGHSDRRRPAAPKAPGWRSCMARPTGTPRSSRTRSGLTCGGRMPE